MGKTADILVPAIPIKKMRARTKANSAMLNYGLNLGGEPGQPATIIVESQHARKLNNSAKSDCLTSGDAINRLSASLY
nr:hypothetical protein [uncultured Desulfobacter sp.]